jgi:hypothetical protein
LSRAASPAARRKRPFPVPSVPGFPPPVTPIQADEMEEFMLIFKLVVFINSLARLLSALAQLIGSLRRQRH